MINKWFQFINNNWLFLQPIDSTLPGKNQIEIVWHQILTLKTLSAYFPPCFSAFSDKKMTSIGRELNQETSQDHGREKCGNFLSVILRSANLGMENFHLVPYLVDSTLDSTVQYATNIKLISHLKEASLNPQTQHLWVGKSNASSPIPNS